MNRIIDLLGMLPNTSALFRMKVAVVGLGALMAGLSFMASGIEGSILRGGLMAACGAVLLGVVSMSNGDQQELNEECAAPREAESHSKEPRQLSSCDHDWVDRDELLNYDPKLLRCSKCGETCWG
jgi:hypothetical protein